jgi:hypothetical protein
MRPPGAPRSGRIWRNIDTPSAIPFRGPSVLDASRGLEPRLVESKATVLPLDEKAINGCPWENRTPARP